MFSEIEIEFVYQPRAKHYIVRFLSEKHLKVTIPNGGTKKEANFFLEEQSAVIQKKLNALRKKEKAEVFIEVYTYKTHFHTVKVLKHQKESHLKIIGQQAFIYLKTEGKSEEEQQEMIEQAFQMILRKEAKQYLPKRTFELAEQFNFKFEQVKVNSAKGRWGSCSSRGNINYSLFLMNLPLHLIDYTILHELSHTIHPNHSSDFWHLLNTCVGGKNMLFKKEMEKYSTKIKAEYYEKINFANHK